MTNQEIAKKLVELVGVNAAKEFGSQMPMMGGVLGGILSSAALANITLLGKVLTPGRGGFISDGIGFIISQTISSDNTIVSVLSGAVSGALFLPLVMIGMHQELTPIHADLIANAGYTYRSRMGFLLKIITSNSKKID
ncbi:hypothetical protein [Clostridium sp.]|uniref:hypothetical protein n=1 Tax=Clostridium sp. TaxID=1506 RepID=UPI0025C53326|nr:hypothetical protein [Clostridium sp.]